MSDELTSLTADVERFLGQCLDRAGLQLSCRCEAAEETITASLYGEDVHLVLRENARLLYALNHLLNQAFYRQRSGRYKFVVDCDDYRSTRILELRLLAKKAAEMVRGSGRPFQLQAMPAGERRIIHLALGDEPGVRTESEGSGGFRRVVILPDSPR